MTWVQTQGQWKRTLHKVLRWLDDGTYRLENIQEDSGQNPD
jgi:hypothetical protein